MITPRTLAEDTISNSTPSIDTWEKQGGVRLKHVRISLHLVGFSCRWFSWDQSWMYSASCCSELCLEAGATSETVESSANFHMWNPSRRRRSFIIARNSHGPKRVPWGTRSVTSNQSDNTPFSFTLCCLLLRKSITQFTTVGFTPRLRSSATNIWWSTRSQAFLKSIKAVLTVEPVPSVACSQWWNMEIRANVVHEPGINPNCAGSMADNSTGFNSLSITKPSATLDKVDVNEMGLRSLLMSLTVGALGTGGMPAIFQARGTLYSEKEVLRISAIGAARISAYSLNTQFGRSSGPSSWAWSISTLTPTTRQWRIIWYRHSCPQRQPTPTVPLSWLVLQ